MELLNFWKKLFRKSSRPTKKYPCLHLDCSASFATSEAREEHEYKHHGRN